METVLVPKGIKVRLAQGTDPLRLLRALAAGVVKYELIWGQFGSSGDRQMRHDADAAQGVVFAQLLQGRKLKFEVFPGKAADEVKGFTTAAKVYER